jgi:outer membrane immunogenic protein
MKKFLVAAIAAAGSCAAFALAAPPALAGPPVYSWTGCYIGGNVGGGWSHTKMLNNVPGGELEFDNRGNSFVEGGQVGCDYQLYTNWVVGVQGMWDGARIKGTFVNSAADVMTVKTNSFATAAATLGYLLNPTTKVYGKLGAGWIDNTYDINTGCVGGGCDQVTKEHRVGFDLGGGLAWIFAPNWDLFVEYDHIFGGTKELELHNLLSGACCRPESTNLRFDKILVGIDFRFNTGR